MSEGIKESEVLPLRRYSPDELVNWLGGNSRLNVAFGFLYLPEDQLFLGAVCRMDEVKRMDQTAEIEFQHTFVAYPFDGSKRRGFALPNTEIDKPEFEFFNESKTFSTEETSQEQYEKQVAEAVRQIKTGLVEKLVLGRRKLLPFPASALPQFIQALVAHQSKANICLMNLPEMGLWVSATPEILLERNDRENELRTMALAGTIKNSDNTHWTEKERIEQGLVGDYIRSAVEKCNLELIKESGPNPVEAGQISHLKTDYIIRSNRIGDFDSLANQLHPTPAVCGLPKEVALKSIQNLEGFDRELYCGFAGIRQPGFSRLVVLLRIGKIENDGITLFAGAGITAESNPKKEWLETEEKLKTLSRWIPDGPTA